MDWKDTLDIFVNRSERLSVLKEVLNNIEFEFPNVSVDYEDSLDSAILYEKWANDDTMPENIRTKAKGKNQSSNDDNWKRLTIHISLETSFIEDPMEEKLFYEQMVQTIKKLTYIVNKTNAKIKLPSEGLNTDVPIDRCNEFGDGTGRIFFASEFNCIFE